MYPHSDEILPCLCLLQLNQLMHVSLGPWLAPVPEIILIGTENMEEAWCSFGSCSLAYRS